MKTQKENKQLEERKIWLRYLTRYVKPNKTVEFGCGSGFVLEVLSKEFPDSIIIGVDKSIERLEKVSEKELENVIPIKADITQNIFPNNAFDTVLFIGTLHELFSYLGKEKVQDAFRIAYNVLKDNGVLIIQDFLKPSSKLAEIALKNEATRRRFIRFTNEFRPRKVKFEKTRQGVKLDIADATEFFSKYRCHSEEDWNNEMGETHFFFTEEEYEKVAQRTSFIIKNSTKLPRSEKSWVKTKEDIEFRFEPEYRWIQLVLIKKQD